MSNDSLGDRMKKYEDVFRTSLPERMPVVLRIDGKAFHSYTKGCKRPFDEKLVEVMNETAEYLCKNIMGARLAYVQSDEISILLTNYNDINSQSWFDNNLQKMVSVSAGMASGVFTSLSPKIFGTAKLAVFDARAWVMPKEDTNNYFLWRQQDCTRNSVQMVARSMYPHKELHKMGNSQLQDMIFKKGTNWNDLPVSQRRGRCIVKEQFAKDGAVRSKWIVDNEIPIFSQDRAYIEKWVYPVKEEIVAKTDPVAKALANVGEIKW